MRPSCGLFLAAVLLSVTGGSGDDAAEEASADLPPTRAGEAVPIDVCQLVGPRAMRRALASDPPDGCRTVSRRARPRR